MELLKIALENKELWRFNKENKSELYLTQKGGERDGLSQAVEEKRLLAWAHKIRYIFPTHGAAGWHSCSVNQSLWRKGR